jgi:toxin ParE1/3/4
VRVVWTDNAISQLIGIYDYIARDSAFYAQRMVDRLTRRSQIVVDFPAAGRVVPEYDVSDIREIIEKPYRILYRVRKEQIDILAVIHGAQLLPSEL